MKLVENALSFPRRDSVSFVSDLYPNHASFVARAKQDARAGRRIFGGVVQNIEEYLFEEDRIELEERELVRYLDRNAMARKNLFGPAQCGTRHVAQVDSFEPGMNRTGFELASYPTDW